MNTKNVHGSNKVQAIIILLDIYTEVSMQDNFTNSSSSCSIHYQWPPLLFQFHSNPNSNPSFLHFPSLFSSFTTHHSLSIHHFQPHSQPINFLLQHHHSSSHPSLFTQHFLRLLPQNAENFSPTRFPHFPFCS